MVGVRVLVTVGEALGLVVPVGDVGVAGGVRVAVVPLSSVGVSEEIMVLVAVITTGVLLGAVVNVGSA
jgi:hypothetical protein